MGVCTSGCWQEDLVTLDFSDMPGLEEYHLIFCVAIFCVAKPHGWQPRPKFSSEWYPPDDHEKGLPESTGPDLSAFLRFYNIWHSHGVLCRFVKLSYDLGLYSKRGQAGKRCEMSQYEAEFNARQLWVMLAHNIQLWTLSATVTTSRTRDIQSKRFRRNTGDNHHRFRLIFTKNQILVGRTELSWGHCECSRWFLGLLEIHTWS